MILVLSQMSTFFSIIKLILLLLLFFCLLFAAHLFTKWYAKSGYVNAKSSNIQIIESQQITQGKNIVIVKVGEKYLSFLMLKENAVFLTELTKEELTLDSEVTKSELSPKQVMTFQEMFQKVKMHKKDKTDEK